MSASANDQALAVLAEVLYLANLMLLPGIAFLGLLGLWLKHRQSASALARCHLRQTVAASVWAGLLLIVVNLLIVSFGGYHQASTWVIVIIYFTTFHATLVLLGVLGLAKAMAGQSYVFPLIGRPCHD